MRRCLESQSWQGFFGIYSGLLCWFLMMISSTCGQEVKRSNLPSGMSFGRRVVTGPEGNPGATVVGPGGGTVSGVGDPNVSGAAAQVDASALIVILAKKSNGGDEVAARALASRLLSGNIASADANFAKEVEEASPAEASRILGLTLLRSGNSELRSEAFALLDKAVAEESVLAMEVMAQILLEGQFGQERSVDKAVMLLRKARQLPGATEAHRLLGDLAISGTGLPKDAAIALEYYRQGAEAGSLASQLALHRLFRSGDPVPKDLGEAERYGRAASDQGSPEAALEMAVFYEQYVDSAPNWLRAAEWLRVATERGNGGAARRLAGYYLTGKPGFPDGAEGIRFLRVAAGLGDAEACFTIGESYKAGKNLPQDPVASTAWVRIAADFGYAAAENAYGLCLMTGYGVASDPAQAAQWFTRSADKGIVEAMVNLGTLHEKGVGLAVNLKEASRLYTLAAEAGFSLAQERLARLLSETQDAGLRDLPLAAFWASCAAESGLEGANTLATRLRESLNASQKEDLDGRLAQKMKKNE